MFHFSIITITSIIFFVIIYLSAYKLSFRMGLVDQQNDRKIHVGKIPLIGGIVIFINSLIISLIFQINLPFELLVLFYSTFLLLILGTYDDLFHLSPVKRLIFQLIAIIIVINSGLSISSLDSHGFQINLGIFSMIFTILCMLVIINSYNFIDGLDGFCSVSFLITIIFILFYTSSSIYDNILLYIISINVGVFLFFNFNFFKIGKSFLGDNGSTSLGFILGFYLIYLYNNNEIQAFDIPWLLAVPIFDFCRVTIYRIKNKISPIEPGLIHLHHILYQKIPNKFLTLLVLVLIIFLFIFFGLILNSFYPKFSLLIYCILFFAYSFILNKSLA